MDTQNWLRKGRRVNTSAKFPHSRLVGMRIGGIDVISAWVDSDILICQRKGKIMTSEATMRTVCAPQGCLWRVVPRGV